MQLKKYPEAIDSLLKAHQINNRDADVCNDLGVSYIHTDQAEKALSAFEQALQLNPAHSDALKNLTVLKEAISQ
jgi:Flp pilus assembly protein TadD